VWYHDTQYTEDEKRKMFSRLQKSIHPAGLDGNIARLPTVLKTRLLWNLISRNRKKEREKRKNQVKSIFKI
jgi:hypothetical protein